ncbi:MAG: GIY-YIG nuclease family protein [Proteobacteria bacterium]|nr:GIY-YIG nuclease family protein [Pseudomonadota bacterium]
MTDVIFEEKSPFYWVYMLECENGSFYTGYTKDMQARYLQHLHGKGGAKYTRANRPLGIARCWQFKGSAGMAMKIEYFIKSKSRREKELLVKNPEALEPLLLDSAGIEVELLVFDHGLINKERPAT